LDHTLLTPQRLHGREPHLRFRLGEWDLASIGDMFIVAGSDESLAPIRDSYEPVIVSDLDSMQKELLAAEAVITQPIVAVPTGRMLFARHADGLHVEYIEWTDELVERFIRAPQRAGRLSSEL
tara:strand:- start:7504 stop:7872 length:369 start_codon:yes stop_codon:yes gene_type:complete